MKLNSDAMNLVQGLNRCPNLLHNLNQAQSRLSCLARQDRDSRVLYQLLGRENQLFQQRLNSLQRDWNCSVNSAFLTCLQSQLQDLDQLTKTHCQLVAWLVGGDDSDAGPTNNMPPPKSPQPPSPRQDSSAQADQALGFN